MRSRQKRFKKEIKLTKLNQIQWVTMIPLIIMSTAALAYYFTQIDLFSLIVDQEL